MRIGQIITLVADRKFGFIHTEHFRDDVFFHFSSVQGMNPKSLRIGQDVEFEIDELMRINQQRLEATLVQSPSRPLSYKLEEERMPEFKAAHHPKARRRRPTWKEQANALDPEVVAPAGSPDASSVPDASGAPVETGMPEGTGMPHPARAVDGADAHVDPDRSEPR